MPFDERNECDPYEYHRPMRTHEHSDCDGSIISHAPGSPYAHCNPHGYSVEEQLNKLWRKVHGMEAEFCTAVNSVDGIINKLDAKVKYNGAYYDKDVEVIEGWSEEDGTAFHIIRIPHKDSTGCPIEFDLHLAYGNTTNSGVYESEFEASVYEEADKLVSGFTGTGNGWSGVCTYDFAPIPSADVPSGFTLGVSKHGRLHWYRNNVDRKQLKNDAIKNSMGCVGILVDGKTATPSLFGETANVKRARVAIGQDYQSKNIYILCVGDFDAVNEIVGGKDYGMTATEAARIMAGYCDIAVTTANLGGNNGAAALDKGSLVIRPTNAIPASNQAFWYISRKASFRNKYTWDVADLRQKYGQLSFYYGLQLDSVTVLVQRLVQLEGRVSALESGLQSLDDREAEHYQELTDTIAEHYEELTEAISDINTEIGNIQVAINSIESAISAIVTKNNQQDGRLDTLDGEIVDINTAIGNINSALSNIDTTIANILLTITGIQSNITDIQADITEVKEALAAVLVIIEQWPDVLAKVDELDGKVSDIDTSVGDIENLLPVFTANIPIGSTGDTNGAYAARFEGTPVTRGIEIANQNYGTGARNYDSGTHNSYQLGSTNSIGPALHFLEIVVMEEHGSEQVYAWSSKSYGSVYEAFNDTQYGHPAGAGGQKPHIIVVNTMNTFENLYGQLSQASATAQVFSQTVYAIILQEDLYDDYYIVKRFHAYKAYDSLPVVTNYEDWFIPKNAKTLNESIIEQITVETDRATTAEEALNSRITELASIVNIVESVPTYALMLTTQIPIHTNDCIIVQSDETQTGNPTALYRYTGDDLPTFPILANDVEFLFDITVNLEEVWEAIENEAFVRETADNDIYGQISAESEARQNAVNDLTDTIGKEAEARSDADSALDERVTELETLENFVWGLGYSKYIGKAWTNGRRMYEGYYAMTETGSLSTGWSNRILLSTVNEANSPGFNSNMQILEAEYIAFDRTSTTASGCSPCGARISLDNNYVQIALQITTEFSRTNSVIKLKYIDMTTVEP